MKFKVKLTPLVLFERAARYLQERIEGTKLGKIRRASGRAIYSTFDDFRSNLLAQADRWDSNA